MSKAAFEERKIVEGKEEEIDLKAGKKFRFQDKWIFKHPFFQYKAPFDNSDYPTIINILVQSGKSFLGGYGILAVLNFLLSLRKFKKILKDPKIVLDALFNNTNLKTGLFLGTYTFVFKSVIALLRIIRNKDDGYTGFLSGFFAGYISFFFVGKKTQSFLACFLLTRALETLYNSAVNKGIIKKTPYNSFILYAIVIIPMVRIGYTEEYCMPESVRKYFHGVAQLSPIDRVLLRATQEVKRKNLTRGYLL